VLELSGPGWVEATLHTQVADGGHPERRIVHLVAYHPRRTTQPIQHVDQSWDTSGLTVKVLAGSRPVERVYLAPDGEALDFTTDGDHTRVDLPPLGAHAVVVLE
jgi:hypothetical protein